MTRSQKRALSSEAEKQSRMYCRATGMRCVDMDEHDYADNLCDGLCHECYNCEEYDD